MGEKVFGQVASHLARRMLHPITLVTCVSAIVLSAFAGPFATMAIMGFAARIALWSLLVLGGTVLGYIARGVVLAFADPDNPFLFEFIAVGVTVVFVAPFVYVVTLVFPVLGCAGFDCFSIIAFYVALTSAAVYLVRRVLPGFEDVMLFVPEADGRVRLVAPSPVPANLADLARGHDATPVRPRLYRRLPEDEQGDIIHLTADGHFVAVTLTTGLRRLRLRFSDAVDEMDSVAGLCTHRSHWVAISAVAGHRKIGNKTMLVLTSGLLVPVSRTYRPGLETAGLLPRLDDDPRGHASGQTPVSSR